MCLSTLQWRPFKNCLTHFIICRSLILTRSVSKPATLACPVTSDVLERPYTE